ncbi:hypothetical protein D9V80_01815 [Buchnera aphidicola (Thelaxes californica)]|uniref:Cytochrome bo(3) ubiquinol oxidase subunit 4 n=1 Tax=Buchnera aphidicola (Thelaxes californica) TaxID=1315998 RepID=A0A4D6YLI7_9GAMM|nr:hypothetical protein [Buchnera aphidicola]QCI26880.1 hypothetical protein D9V80_01815 [Buchnera aphidicola (Thelaxes californica)]
MITFLKKKVFFSTIINNYFIGFFYSCLISVLSFIIIQNNKIFNENTFFILITLSILQLMIQIIYFFDIKKFVDWYWSICILIFSLLVILIILSGSIWIMHNVYCGKISE